MWRFLQISFQGNYCNVLNQGSPTFRLWTSTSCQISGGIRLGLPRCCSGKESACQYRRNRRCGFDPLVGKIPWSRKLTPVFLPGKSHGQRSLVGYSPRGCKESDMTERLHFHFSFSCFGEGNGNPLQCPCLENPRDGGACWAAVYGVAQSRTWLKWLSIALAYI